MYLSTGSSAVDYSDPAKPFFKGAVGMGGRGVAIYRTEDMKLVWDSGSMFEKEARAAHALILFPIHSTVEPARPSSPPLATARLSRSRASGTSGRTTPSRTALTRSSRVSRTRPKTPPTRSALS